MPRNVSTGVYSPTSGQPVVSGTTIDPTVFNNLVADVGNEITYSIDVRGETPMTAALNLASNKIVNMANGSAATDGVAYGQLNSSGVPIGSMAAWPSLVALPAGWLRSTSGATASRSANPTLFALISTAWGSGDGSTTFGLPNVGLDNSSNHIYGIIKGG